MKILCLLFSIGCFLLLPELDNIDRGDTGPNVVDPAQSHAQLEQTGANFLLE